MDLSQLKATMRSTWIAGDFGKIAEYTTFAAEEFVDRLPITPGMHVLDVACGTGNLAIPAARKGAVVTGIDIAPNLLEQARHRASSEGLQVAFEEGDAEQLPYADASFDLVMSMFGAMFAPSPEEVAKQFARVCRKGGILAMANWTRHGFTGKMFRLNAQYVAPPEGIPAPVLWGDEEAVLQRLSSEHWDVRTTRREILFDYPFPSSTLVDFFRRYFGPTQMTFARLDPAAQTALASDLTKLWDDHNEAIGDRTLVPNEYLEVTAIRL